MAILPPVLVELKAELGDFKAKLGEAQAEIEGMASQGSGSFDKLAKAGGMATLAIGASAVAIAGFSVEAADQFEAAHGRLQTALENTGSSFDAINPVLDAAQKHMENFGYSNADVQSALASLTTGLGDPQKALADLGTVADLAAKQHMSLTDASDAFVKASVGSGRALKLLGVTTDEYKTALANGTLQQLLASKVQGAAETQADTFHGKMVALEAKVKDWGVAIGLWLIPKIEAMVEWLQKAGEWLGRHQAVLIGLGVVIGSVLVAAFTAWAISAATAAVATLTAMAPILLVGAAVAGLAAGLIWAYQNVDIFHDTIDAVGRWLRDTLWPIMRTVFKDIIEAVKAVIRFVQDNWHFVQDVFSAVWTAIQLVWDNVAKPLLDLHISVVQGIVSFFQAAWPLISGYVQVAWGVVQGVWDAIGQPILDLHISVVQGIVDFWSGAWGLVSSAFSTAWGAIQGAWDSVGYPVFAAIYGAYQTYISVLLTVWDDIKGAFQTAWGALQGIWDSTGGPVFKAIGDAINTVLGFAQDLIGALQTIASMGGLGDTLGSQVDAVNKFKQEHGGGPPLSGARARGGPVMAGGAYLVGEHGPEIFVPGSSGGIIPNGMRGGTVIHIGTLVSRAMSGDELYDELLALQRRVGPLQLSTAS